MSAADFWIDELEKEGERRPPLHPIVRARRNIEVARGMARASHSHFTGATLDMVLDALNEAARELVLVLPLPSRAREESVTT